MGADPYLEAIEAISAAHKRGHLVAVCWATLAKRNTVNTNMIGEGSAMAALNEAVAEALESSGVSYDSDNAPISKLN